MKPNEMTSEITTLGDVEITFIVDGGEKVTLDLSLQWAYQLRYLVENAIPNMEEIYQERISSSSYTAAAERAERASEIASETAEVAGYRAERAAKRAANLAAIATAMSRDSRAE